ncbi:unnamed protein product [Dicrocoelium dendriticum]|nr:unnamed protein product [Dicrocoelium dendriticum]
MLLTTPVLVDPYLVSKSNPIEVPYRSIKVATIESAQPELTDVRLAQVETALSVGSLNGILKAHGSVRFEADCGASFCGSRRAHGHIRHV